MKVDAIPLTEPLPRGGSKGTSVAVEPLLGAEVRAPRSFFEAKAPGSGAMLSLLASPLKRSEWEWWPIPAFLIHHPEAGAVLVDTGFHPSVAVQPSANLGKAGAAFNKVRMREGHSIAAQLRDKGHDPKSIETVVMTHLHYDHASAISEFPNAQFILSASEWEAATTVYRPLLHGYRRAHFDFLFDYRTIDFDGERISSYASFGRTFDLFGDGSIRLAFTPGHTEGHMSVICRLAERDLVIAGDAIYTTGQLRGESMPPRPENFHKWERSLRELQRFHSQFPEVTIIPGHDPDAWADLDDRYE
jgi:glyoxylase-like metal-dependent hydrolase (beta-lactamase superfamily II)